MTTAVPTTGAVWPALGTTAHVVVADSTVLAEAEALVRRQLAELDETCSRFRDSELTRLRPGRQRVGPLLADVLRAALDVAVATDGLVDPTLGRAMDAAGYDRTFGDLPEDGPTAGSGSQGRWRDVHLYGDVLDLPDVRLDLGATAKAWAADRAVIDITDRWGTDVLVSLGGDVACTGTWPVLVGDPGQPTEVVEVTGGLATSSTGVRRWRRGGRAVSHVVDPRTGRPVADHWRTVTVSAATCLEANAASTAAAVLGPHAVGWLRDLPARLVPWHGPVVRTGGWP